MRSTPLIGVMALLVASCAPEPAEVAIDDGIQLLDARQQLIRLSVDLRGVHPTEEELLLIEQYPLLYDDFVERYLYDARFGDRIEEVFNVPFRTRTGETYFDLDEAGVGGLDERVVAKALADEPLKLISYVTENDLPWSEIVTAEYTMANAVTAAFWGLEYPDGAIGWQPAYYTDGREHAGVLTMTTMWSRYPSAGVNSNRHRANTVSRILLCDDYLARPVSFARTQIDALTSGDPEEVIRDTEICQSCHSSLDPLSSHFFGFWWEIDGDMVDQTTYRPEDEELWMEYSGKSPGYFGLPTANMTEMAQALSEDDRFVDCTVRTVFEGMTQRDTSDLDWTELARHKRAFEDSGLVMRDLVRSIVNSREYKAGGFDDPQMAARIPTVKTVSPAQLSSIVSAKTDYMWTLDGWDALANNDQGLGVLAGGTDSRYVTIPSHDPSVGLVFIQERLAQSAAYHVASHDLAPGREGDAILLHYVTMDDDPDQSPEAFRYQIRELYNDVTGVPLPEQATEPDELMVMWEQMYSVDASPVSAWAGVISVVVRDPRVIFY